MQLLRFDRFFRCCSALLAAAVFQGAHAAELGEAQVTSYIGQALMADIEVVALADPGALITVKNASADVYRGANLAIHPVLASVTLAVVKRDGRQFVRVSSTRPVDSDYVHLFLDLAEGGKHQIRPVTLWLTPDPAPPRPVAAVPVAAAAKAPPVVAKAPPVRVAEPAPPREAEPEAPPPVRKSARVITLGSPTTCARPTAEEQAKLCAGADYKNGLLSAQVVELEEKVRQLQAIIDGKAADALAAQAASATAAPPAPAKPAIAPPPVKAAPAPAKSAPPADTGFPWALVAGIIGALMALGGAATVLVLKHRRGAAAEERSPGWFSTLAGRLRRKTPASAAAPAQAPPEA